MSIDGVARPQTPKDGDSTVANPADGTSPGQLARRIDQLQEQIRRQEASIAFLAEGGTPHPSASLPSADAALNQIRDHLALIERSLEAHLEAALHAEQLAVTERERERRELGDLVHQIEAISRVADEAGLRAAAAVEEVRQERGARAPLVQSLEQLERVQTGLQGRLAVLDEITRRYNGIQTTIEQQAEKQQTELNRLDNLNKLLDVRLSRELAEIRQRGDEWMAQAAEQLKPISGLARQVATLAEQREQIDRRAEAMSLLHEHLSTDVARLEADARNDRASMTQFTEITEVQRRRLDESESALAQVGERLAALTSTLTNVRAESQAVNHRVDELERRLIRLVGSAERADAGLARLEGELHDLERSSREDLQNAAYRSDEAISSLSQQVAARQRLGADQLRRTISELQLQLRELDAEL